MAAWEPAADAVIEIVPDADVLAAASEVVEQLLHLGFESSWESLARTLVYRMRDFDRDSGSGSGSGSDSDSGPGSGSGSGSGSDSDRDSDSGSDSGPGPGPGPDSGSDSDRDSDSGFGEIPLVFDQAKTIAKAMWADRVAEQTANWSGPTDGDRLAEAFSALEGEGIVARPDFACCGSCGLAEIGAHLREESTGFVFFHRQDTETLAEGGALLLRYGAADGDGDTAAVGHRVVERVRAAGLDVEWDGSPELTIEVTLDWRKRLPGVPGAVAWPGASGS